MIAGGGTGGHIYPAIAIGRAITKSSSDYEVRFVGTPEGLEKKIMARENLPLDLILSGKFNFSGNPLLKIKTLIKIPIGFIQSIFLILKYKPVFVLGVGGYASAPFLLMAALLGRKSALWEPNAHPGMANRILSKFISKAYLVFAEAQKDLSSKSCKVIGMPLREEIDQAQLSQQKKVALAGRLNILCFGGSQGSVFLNTALSDFILQHPELHSEIEVIHQTGSLGFKDMQEKYKNIACVQIHEFIFDMPNYYKKADVQFCRGGASTIAEAAAFGVVPIIIPLPAADNHQLRNAEAVVQAEAGFLFKQNEFKAEDFYQLILKLKNDLNYRLQLSENLKKLAPHQAAFEIAKDVIQQVENNK
jgi:UDP-N-acetylglucosamine--N-acetylmuramyl-(pentapeptide) pyrophosphoryl-undecaprenol N-acetylglucosamine transferase